MTNYAATFRSYTELCKEYPEFSEEKIVQLMSVAVLEEINGRLCRIAAQLQHMDTVI